MNSKTYRIAFSFAGEKRHFVEQVASILAQRFTKDKILYDEYHRPKFSRARLAYYLQYLYKEQTDLIVAVLCPNYDKKEWCGIEWDVIFGLIKAGKESQIMLTRFGQVEGRGLQDNAGYTGLDNMSPEQLADDILERLADNEGLPRDYYKVPAGSKPAKDLYLK